MVIQAQLVARARWWWWWRWRRATWPRTCTATRPMRVAGDDDDDDHVHTSRSGSTSATAATSVVDRGHAITARQCHDRRRRFRAPPLVRVVVPRARSKWKAFQRWRECVPSLSIYRPLSGHSALIDWHARTSLHAPRRFQFRSICGRRWPRGKQA